MEIRPPREAAADPALAAWRSRAANVVLAVTTGVHLPSVVMMMLGYGLPATSMTRGLILAAYLVMVPSAFLYRLDYRIRLLAFFVAAYAVVALSSIESFSAPYAQLGPVVHPILVLVLCGSVAARVGILASATILLAAPFARLLPGVARTLVANSAMAASPPGVFWSYAAASLAFLATLMVLLDRFHQFLLDALHAQRRVTAGLEHEMRERHRLEREIAAIGDEERRRLGQELHDGVCQQVAAALLRCQALKQSVERGSPISVDEFGPLTSLLSETIDDAHDVALGLCPLEPDPDALAPALRSLVRQVEQMAGIRCEFLATGDVRVPDLAMAQHLYRIAQEALSNAVRHAHADRISVELRGSSVELAVQVEDNGTGLPPGRPPIGMGLRTMEYRARILEGTLAVTSVPGSGTRVTCSVPRPVAPPAAPGASGGGPWIPA